MRNTLRYIKILMVVILAFLFTLTALDNLIDFNTNFAFVQHVLSMDTIADSGVKSRAIHNPFLHLAAYYLIILCESLIASLLWLGSYRMLRNVNNHPHAFYESKRWAYVGLFLGFFLFSFAFITIGGEWFDMWRSPRWNGQKAAEMMITLIMFVILFLKGTGEFTNE